MNHLDFSQQEGNFLNDVQRPVYLQDWWLNIAAQSQNQNESAGNHRLSVFEEDIEVGTMTYTIIMNRLGIKRGGDPILSRVGGPFIPDCEGDAILRQQHRDKVASKLIAQLPSNVSLSFTLPPESTDHTLFMAAGFSYSYEYSYRISPGDPSKIRSRFFYKMRSRLRKAERELDIDVATPELFIEFYAENLKRAGLRPSFPLDTAYKLLKEGLKRGQVRITIAHYKGATKPVAALASVWDKNCYYSWLATYRLPEKQRLIAQISSHVRAILKRRLPPVVNTEPTSHPCAIRFLLWSAMLDAHSRGLTFDLDGTKKSETEHLYKEFNGLRVVRHILSRETLNFKFWTTIRNPLVTVLTKCTGIFGPIFH